MRKLRPSHSLVVMVSVAFQASSAKRCYIVFENAKELRQSFNRKTLPYPPLNAHKGAIAGVSVPQTGLRKGMLHRKDIVRILKIRGNLGQKAKANLQQKGYAQLVAKEADILLANELKLASDRLNRYRKINKIQ